MRAMNGGLEPKHKVSLMKLICMFFHLILLLHGLYPWVTILVTQKT